MRRNARLHSSSRPTCGVARTASSAGTGGVAKLVRSQGASPTQRGAMMHAHDWQRSVNSRFVVTDRFPQKNKKSWPRRDSNDLYLIIKLGGARAPQVLSVSAEQRMCPLLKATSLIHWSFAREHTERPACKQRKHFMSRRMKKCVGSMIAVCIIAAIVLQLTTNESWAKKKPAFGTITKFATVPADPGFPEGVAVHGNSVFVSGPARFGTA